ncbi:uncharacterized protein LOC118419390 [Branchiostoma floridae]|uniref:Uncharacterized protein LOC118419390 n=1 Tax=Branchiostoma floridae TaxID=7739 RepID=A0A9J7MWQ3_BRAFL|nr:uncharacterized protein LOC118419390 [Branchiostoma floridae]
MSEDQKKMSPPSDTVPSEDTVQLNQGEKKVPLFVRFSPWETLKHILAVPFYITILFCASYYPYLQHCGIWFGALCGLITTIANLVYQIYALWKFKDFHLPVVQNSNKED